MFCHSGTMRNVISRNQNWRVLGALSTEIRRWWFNTSVIENARMPQVSFYFKFLQNKIKCITTGHYSIACQRNNEQCVRTPAAYLIDSVSMAFLIYQNLDHPFSWRRCLNLQLRMSGRTHESELSIRETEHTCTCSDKHSHYCLGWELESPSGRIHQLPVK